MQLFRSVQRSDDGDDHGGHEGGADRRILSYCKDVCGDRFRCVPADAEVHGGCCAGSGGTVLRGVSAAAVCFHSAQSVAFFEKVFSCNDVCVYDGNIQCDHPAFHRYTG